MIAVDTMHYIDEYKNRVNSYILTEAEEQRVAKSCFLKNEERISYDWTNNTLSIKKDLCLSFIRTILSKMEEYFGDIPFFFIEMDKYLVIKTPAKSEVFDEAYDRFYVNFYYDFLKTNKEEKEIVVKFVTE